MNMFCLPKILCNHALGKEHKISHRMFVGIFIMSIGVGIAKSTGFFESHTVHFVLDMTGYGVHGLGCTPFIEYLMAEV